MIQPVPTPKVNVHLRGGPADGVHLTVPSVTVTGMPEPRYTIGIPVGSKKPDSHALYELDRTASQPVVHYALDDDEEARTGHTFLVASTLIFTFKESQ